MLRLRAESPTSHLLLGHYHLPQLVLLQRELERVRVPVVSGVARLRIRLLGRGRGRKGRSELLVQGVLLPVEEVYRLNEHLGEGPFQLGVCQVSC